jgi:hypothetical protein
MIFDAAFTKDFGKELTGRGYLLETSEARLSEMLTCIEARIIA